MGRHGNTRSHGHVSGRVLSNHDVWCGSHGFGDVSMLFYYAEKEDEAVFVSSAIASFLTGVTEPLEFSFMFLSPLLYVMHALLTGISVFMAASLQYIAGFSFSAGAIDFVLASSLPMAVKPYMLFVQGGLFFVIYYVLFRLMIKKFDLCTPGRENDQNEPFQEGSIAAEDLNEMAKSSLKAVAGQKISLRFIPVSHVFISH